MFNPVGMVLSKPLLIGAAVAIVVCSAIAAGVGYDYGSSKYAAKLNANEAAWQGREAKINADTANKIAELNKRNNELQRAWSVDVANVSKDYQQQIERTKDEAQRALALHRSGAQRLSIAARCPSGAPAGNGGVSNASPAAAGRDVETRADLTDGAADFLTRLAQRGDDAIRQLTACQALVETYQRMAGPSAAESSKR